MLLLLFAAMLTTSSGVQVRSGGDKTITKVVKLLQGMLDKSKSDAEADRVMFAKFKCYCDANEEERTKSVEDLTEEIGFLSSKIEQLQGSNGKLSEETRGLRADMTTNENDRATAQGIRTKAHEDFVAEEADLNMAISQMESAIGILGAIGADQTMESGADHEKFMAGYEGASLIKMNTQVKQALQAASAFLSPQEKKRAGNFLQAPFTGNYAAQSGQILGILKNMRDTFKANLENAITAEDTANSSHHAFMAAAAKSHADMLSSFNTKQGTLGSNDIALGTKRGQLSTAETSKSDDEDFLDSLRDTCQKKTAIYEKRKTMRANEDAAIAEAISILNSDAAFATFGKVAATSTGGTGAALFLQMGSRHRRISEARLVAQKLLRKIAASEHSQRLDRAASMLEAGNPFAQVIEEIDKMIALIDDEHTADEDNLSWCNDERTRSDGDIGTKKSEIMTLKGQINALKDTISKPPDGLEQQIENNENALETCIQAQKDQTKTRKEENVDYQKASGHLEESHSLLTKAIDVLDKYYATVRKDIDDGVTGAEELLQRREDPNPPGTWDAAYQGQSTKGNSAITMLQYILSQTEAETTSAHSAEETLQ